MANTCQPAASISRENPYLDATQSNGCRQQSANASVNDFSESAPWFALLIASKADANSCSPTSLAVAKQLSRSKITAFVMECGMRPTVRVQPREGRRLESQVGQLFMLDKYQFARIEAQCGGFL